MASLINPQFVKFDPSFDYGQPAIVPYLATFVGVRTKMNLRMMEERLKRADPTIWWTQAQDLRKQATELRLAAAGITEADAEQRGKFATQMMGSLGQVEAAHKSASASQQTGEMAALAHMETNFLNNQTELIKAGLLSEDGVAGITTAMGATLKEREPTDAEKRLAKKRGISADAVAIGNERVLDLKTMIDDVTATVPAQKNATVLAWQQALGKAEEADAAGDEEMAEQYRYIADRLDKERLQGQAAIIAASLSEPMDSDEFQKRQQAFADAYGVGGWDPDEMIEVIREVAPEMFETGPPKSVLELQEQARRLDERAAFAQARGDYFATADLNEIISGGSEANLWTRPLNTRTSRYQADLDLVEAGTVPAEDPDYVTALQQHRSPRAAVESLQRAGGPSRRELAPATDIGAFLRQIGTAALLPGEPGYGEQHEDWDAISEVVATLPPGIREAFQYDQAQKAREAGDPEWGRWMLDAAEAMQAEGDITMTSLLQRDLDDLRLIADEREFADRAAEIADEIVALHPTLRGEAHDAFVEAVNAFASQPRPDVAALRKSVDGVITLTEVELADRGERKSLDAEFGIETLRREEAARTRVEEAQDPNRVADTSTSTWDVPVSRDPAAVDFKALQLDDAGTPVFDVEEAQKDWQFDPAELPKGENVPAPEGDEWVNIEGFRKAHIHLGLDPDAPLIDIVDSTQLPPGTNTAQFYYDTLLDTYPERFLTEEAVPWRLGGPRRARKAVAPPLMEPGRDLTAAEKAKIRAKVGDRSDQRDLSKGGTIYSLAANEAERRNSDEWPSWGKPERNEAIAAVLNEFELQEYMPEVSTEGIEVDELTVEEAKAKRAQELGFASQ